MQPNAVPTSPDDLRQAVRARGLRLGTLLAMLITLSYGVGYWAAGRWTMVAIEAVSLVAFVATYLLARKHENTARGLTGLVCVALAYAGRGRGGAGRPCCAGLVLAVGTDAVDDPRRLVELRCR